MSGDYHQAENWYKKASQLQQYDVDYAIYQQGRAQGIQQKYTQQIKTLKQLIPDHQNSLYYDKAILEIANSYFETNQADNAIQYYRIITDSLPESKLYAQALIQLGLIHYNKNLNEKGLTYYKKAFQNARDKSEEQKALTGIRNVYMDMNQPESFFSYIEEVEGKGAVSTSEKDSLSFEAARNTYMKNDCPNTIRKFEQYIQDYPEGAFLLESHYFLADCRYREEKFSQALEDYQYILAEPRNEFTEEALLMSARIQYKNEDYRNAIQTYQSVEKIAETHEKKNEAIIQIMRSYYQLQEYGTMIEKGKKVLALEKIEPELTREVHFKMGKSYQAVDRSQEAISSFTQASSEVKSVEGAESKYQLIKLYYEREQWNDAKREIFDLIELNTGHRYWLAKSFLVLADIYMQEEDNFQAIHTLKSLIDNYESQQDGIIEEAKEKLARLTSEQPQKDSILQL